MNNGQESQWQISIANRVSFGGTGLRKKHSRKGTARFSEKTEEGENPKLDWEEKSEDSPRRAVSQAGSGRELVPAHWTWPAREEAGGGSGGWGFPLRN